MKRRTLLSIAAAASGRPEYRQRTGGQSRCASCMMATSPCWTRWSATYPDPNHAFMVFDTLYGQDNAYRTRPQMVAGHVTENDGKTWKLTLREGLTFHDGSKVLARDAVASVARWGKRDSFGQALMARVDEMSAPDDRTIQFRLKTPFTLLPDALGHFSPSMCAHHAGAPCRDRCL